jgi:hypothetical protein
MADVPVSSMGILLQLKNPTAILLGAFYVSALSRNREE